MAATSPRVIVVEDDDGMRAAIARLFDAAGIESAVYPSAESLLDCGAWQDAACVVTDQRLPVMSGLDLVAHLRSQGEAPPVVLITAHDTPELRQEATRRGAVNYLAKPFLGTALVAVVRSVIEDTKT